MLGDANEHPNLHPLHPLSLQEMMAAFEAEATKTNRPRLMLTAAVAAGQKNIDAGYQVPQLGASVHCR